jgi:hypothetical protein
MKVQAIATFVIASLAHVVSSTKTIKLSAENVNWGFFSKTVPPAAYIKSGEGKFLLCFMCERSGGGSSKGPTGSCVHILDSRFASHCAMMSRNCSTRFSPLSLF